VPRGWQVIGKRRSAKEARRQRHVCNRLIFKSEYLTNSPLESGISPAYGRVTIMWSSHIVGMEGLETVWNLSQLEIKRLVVRISYGLGERNERNHHCDC
jgi:hypothetical protein